MTRLRSWGLRALLAVVLVAVVHTSVPLTESSGFHCKTKLSMKLDRRLHGEPRAWPPPFDLQVLDEHGQQTQYYELGKIYTIRLIGYTHYRGLLLQARLCDEYGFVIGSLRGGRFLETPDWLQYGIRMQECDLRYPMEDSITHADDSRKFVTQIQWTTSRDVGNVQFMLTIASENDIYWERWRPHGGFLRPMVNKNEPNHVLRQVFYNEKYALKFLAGKLTSQEARINSHEMPKLEEVIVTSEKPTMAPEAMDALAKMEMPEFWELHDGMTKVDRSSVAVDLVATKTGHSSGVSAETDNLDSGEALLANTKVFDQLDAHNEHLQIDENPSAEAASTTTETTEKIPAHESITQSPEQKAAAMADNVSNGADHVNSGEATVAPADVLTTSDLTGVSEVLEGHTTTIAQESTIDVESETTVSSAAPHLADGDAVLNAADADKVAESTKAPQELLETLMKESESTDVPKGALNIGEAHVAVEMAEEAKAAQVDAEMTESMPIDDVESSSVLPEFASTESADIEETTLTPRDEILSEMSTLANDKTTEEAFTEAEVEATTDVADKPETTPESVSAEISETKTESTAETLNSEENTSAGESSAEASTTDKAVEVSTVETSEEPTATEVTTAPEAESTSAAEQTTTEQAENDDDFTQTTEAADTTASEQMQTEEVKGSTEAQMETTTESATSASDVSESVFNVTATAAPATADEATTEETREQTETTPEAMLDEVSATTTVEPAAEDSDSTSSTVPDSSTPQEASSVSSTPVSGSVVSSTSTEPLVTTEAPEVAADVSAHPKAVVFRSR